jgi:ABC-type nitrate/sulfonate/bicarbonate transport system substrate-binding protein
VPDIFTVLQSSSIAMGETRQNLETVRKLTRQIEHQTQWINSMRENYRKLRQEVNLQKIEIYHLKLLVRKYRINEQPKRVPFWARTFWQKFIDFSRQEYDQDMAAMEEKLTRLETERREYLEEFPEYFKA